MSLHWDGQLAIVQVGLAARRGRPGRQPVAPPLVTVPSVDIGVAAS